MLFHVPTPSDGTSLYRSQPYKRIKGLELVPYLVTKDNFTWADIYDINICFFQRPSNQIEVRTIDACKKMNKPIIVDYDDYTLEINNKSNPAVEHYDKDSVKACIKECLRLADIITVSTEGLKQAFLEHVPTANIVVIPNAVDDELFDLKPSLHERRKIIAMRGAGSHKYDWEAYKPGILQLLRDNPDYQLAVMGYHPEWLREVPTTQILYYEFTDIQTYLHTLMRLRPKLFIVPLVDDKFNRCKSAIGLYEGVLAGAVVCSPKLPEFVNYGSEWFTGNEDLVKTSSNLLRVDNDWLYSFQLSKVPRLSKVNELRKDIIENLKPGKYKPTMPVLRVATDQEFNDYELSRGHNIEDQSYAQGHTKAVEWIVKTVNPKTAIEYGSGMGATLLFMLKAGIMAYGLEINPNSVEYFQEHYPMYKDQVKLVDFLKEPIESDEPCDLGLSIEVFEHIKMDEGEWDKFILSLSKLHRKFYFSSTPYHTTEEFDHFWGHINIRRTTDWVKLFERNGWKLINHPRVLTNWDCLFESTNVV